MEKYAVEIDKEQIKTASNESKCPQCGKELGYKGLIPYCSNCGTEPFEKRR